MWKYFWQIDHNLFKLFPNEVLKVIDDAAWYIKNCNLNRDLNREPVKEIIKKFSIWKDSPIPFEYGGTPDTRLQSNSTGLCGWILASMSAELALGTMRVRNLVMYSIKKIDVKINL